MSGLLVFEGKGVYEPEIVEGELWWWLNYNGNPLCGVQVNNMRHAKKFAKVTTLWHFKRLCQEQLDDEMANELSVSVGDLY